MVIQDLRRYVKDPTSGWLWPFLSTPGFRFMVLHRLCNRFSSMHPIGIISRLWHKRMRVKFGFQIPHSTRIEAGLFMGHFGGIVINARTTIGRNCNVAQGVTIGQINRGSKQGCPTIGNQVWIGPNAVVVGEIKIGSNVLIAPLSYVNFDVPDNSVVMGNPGKVVGDSGSTGYVNNLVE
jgi:serine O-acetyltransferase